MLLLTGRWETMDHQVQGRWQHAGGAACDRHLAALLSAAVRPPGSVGRVVVATERYSRRGEQPDASLYPEDDLARPDG